MAESDDAAKAQGKKSSKGAGSSKRVPRALELRKVFRRHAIRAAERLAELLESEDGAIAMRVATTILDRAFGAPGREAEVRQVDAGRMEDAHEREKPGSRTLLSLDSRPPPDVD